LDDMPGQRLVVLEVHERRLAIPRKQHTAGRAKLADRAGNDLHVSKAPADSSPEFLCGGPRPRLRRPVFRRELLPEVESGVRPRYIGLRRHWSVLNPTHDAGVFCVEAKIHSREAISAAGRLGAVPIAATDRIAAGTEALGIGEERVRVYLFVATLGYSRRPYVGAFLHERQASWLAALEATFRHFNGIPEEVPLDDPRALVSQHDVQTRTVTFNSKFLAFARHWGFRPRACAPYRARTKGKDESGVGYVKHNAVAGHTFESWHAPEAQCACSEDISGIYSVRRYQWCLFRLSRFAGTNGRYRS